MDTFLPAQLADEEMEVNVDPKVIGIQFGDGYRQEIGDGINNDLDKMRPRWTNLRASEAQPIIDFLRPKAKTRTPFWYTPNGESAARSVKCIRFSYAWKKGRFCNINADFEEAAPSA
jgi:phage-related protein